METTEASCRSTLSIDVLHNSHCSYVEQNAELFPKSFFNVFSGILFRPVMLMYTKPGCIITLHVFCKSAYSQMEKQVNQREREQTAFQCNCALDTQEGGVTPQTNKT